MFVAAKRIVIVLTILILLPIVLVGGGVLFLSSPWGEDLVRKEAVTRLEALTGLVIEIGDLETSVLNSLTLSNVRAYHPEVAPETNLLAFKRLHIDYDLLPLLSKTIRVDSLAIDSLAGHVIKQPSGLMNLPSLKSDTSAVDTSSAPFPYEFSLGGVRVHIADASYRDEVQPFAASLDNLVLQIAGGSYKQDEEQAYPASLDSLLLDIAGASYRDETRPLAASLDSLALRVHGEGKRYQYDLAWGDAHLDTDGRQLSIEQFLLGGRVHDDTLKVDTLYAAIPGADLAGRAEADIVVGADSTRDVLAGVKLAVQLDQMNRLLGDMLPEALSPLGGSLTIDALVEGTAEDPQATIKLDSPGLSAGNYELAVLRVRAEGSKQRVRVNELYVESYGGSLDGSVEVDLTGTMQHTLDLRLKSFDLERLQEAFAQPEPGVENEDRAKSIRGSFGGQVSSSGPLKEIWLIEANASLAALVEETIASEPKLYRINLGYKDHNGRLAFQRGESTVRATARIDSNSFDGDFTLDVPRITELIKPIGVDSLTGSLSAKGRFRGSPSNPQITAQFQAGSILYRKFPLDTLAASVYYDTSGVRIDSSFFAGAMTRIDSSTAPMNLVDLRGNFSYRGEVRGRLPDMTGSLDLRGDSLGYGVIESDSVDAKLLFRRGRVEIPKFQVFRADRRVTLQGNYQLEESSGEMSLWFTGPDSAEKRVSITEREVLGRAGPARLQDVRLGDGRLVFGFALLDSNRIKVSGGGRKVNLANAPRVHAGLEGLHGVLAMGLSFEGSPDDPHAAVQLQVDSLSSANFVVDSLRVVADVDSIRAKTDLHMVLSSGQTLEGTLTLPLRQGPNGVIVSENERLSGELVGSGIQLSLLNQLLPKDMDISGLLDISYHAGGTLAKPSLLGEINLDSTTVVLGRDKPTLDSLSLNVTQFDTDIRMERIDLKTLGHQVRFYGAATLLEGNAVDGRLDMRIDDKHAFKASGHYGKEGYNATIELPEMPLEPFEEMVDAIVDLQGTLTGTATVEGDTGMPKIQGNLRGKITNLDLAQTDANLHHGDFALSLDSKSVTIDTLSAKWGEKGVLILEGGLELVEKRPEFDFKLRATNIDVKQEDFTATLDGMTVTFITNENGRHVLSGDIRPGEMRYTRDYRLDTILRQINAPPTRKIQKPSELAQNIELELRVREADNLWIDNNLAEVRVAANIEARGTLGNPILTGRVILEEGYVWYLDNRFTLEEGTIDFVDTRSINPYLNIAAKTEVTEYEQGEQFKYTITLLITGDMKQAKIEFLSDPYLEQSSILTLLTFGTTQTGESGVGGQAGSLAGRALSGYLGSRVGSAIGIDQVSVQGNLFAPDEGGATLMATQDISNRAEITYITNVSDLTESKVRISYFLNKNWTVTGETNQQGEGSVDLKLKVRWNEIEWR